MLFDFFKYLLLLVIIYPLLVFHNSNFFLYFIILIGFIIANSLFIYALSFFFDKEENGPKFYSLITILGCFVLCFYEGYKVRKLNDFFNDNFHTGLAYLFPSSNLLISMYDFWFSVLFKDQKWAIKLVGHLSTGKIVCKYKF